MRYFVRSVKYFLYFSFWTTIIVLALVLTGMAGGDINEIFEGGWNAVWKIAIFFAVIASVYPKVAFFTKTLDVQKDLKDARETIVDYMRAKEYILEKESEGQMTFRYRSLGGRLARMNEDRIVLTQKDGALTIEGLRKDVLKSATGLEYKLNDCQ